MKLKTYNTKFCIDDTCDTSQSDIQGYASVYDVPHYGGDIVSRGAFTEYLADIETKTIPLVFEHETENIHAYIGTVNTVKDDEKGLYITASFNDSPEAEKAKMLVDSNVLQDFSIGIVALDYEPNEKGETITKAFIREVSLVLTGDNPEAKIETQDETPEQDAELSEEVTDETPNTNETEQTDLANNTAKSNNNFTSEKQYEKEYSMIQVMSKDSVKKNFTAGQSLLKQLKENRNKESFELKTYSAGNEGAIRYGENGLMSIGEDVVSLTGYAGVDYLDYFTVVDTDSNTLAVTKVNYDSSVAPAETGDGELKPKIGAEVTTVNNIITKLAGYISISDACIEDGLYNVIDPDLAELLVKNRNTYLINELANGTIAETYNGPVLDEIIRTAAMLNAKGANELTLIIDANDVNSLYNASCCGSDLQAQLEAFGVTNILVVTGNQLVNDEAFILADLRSQRVFRRTGIRVERATQSEDHFIHDISDYRVYQRLGLFLRREDLVASRKRA